MTNKNDQPTSVPEVHLQFDDEKTSLLDIKGRQKQKKLSNFYSKQADFLEAVYKDKDHLENNGEDETKFQLEGEKKARKNDENLAKAAFGLNVILLAAKVAAAYLSGSLAVVSTVIESAVDITSGITIWLTVRAIENTDPFEYPRGRPKLEPLAIVIVSTIMGVASVQVIIQSVQSITSNSINPEVDIATMTIIGVTVCSKLTLLIFCLRQKTPNARVLAIDQRNDVFTNTFAIICALIGQHFWLLADPLGAIAVSLVVCCTWFYVAWGQIPIISGKRASREYINRVITICCNHEPPVKFLDKVLVYHYGSKYLVEVKVVMPCNTNLNEANKLVSSLQWKLELLPDVERAFVRAICPKENVIGKRNLTSENILAESPPAYQNGHLTYEENNNVISGTV